MIACISPGSESADHSSNTLKYAIRLKSNKKQNQTISQITASGCKPTISYKGKKRCTALMRYAFEQVIPSGKYDKIIISARWKMDDLSWLLRTLDQIEGTRAEVTVFGPIIEYTQPLPRILAHSDHEEKLVRTRKYDFIQKIDAEFEKNRCRTRDNMYKIDHQMQKYVKN